MAEELYSSSSYPPVFLELNPADTTLPHPLPLLPSSTDMVDDNIPLLDLQALDPQAISHASSNWGLFLLVNHGVPPGLYQQVRRHATQLFSLPFHFKQAQLASPPVKYFWGSPAVTCNVHNLNWLEGLQVAPLSPTKQYHTLANTKQPDHYPLVEDFRNVVEAYGLEMARVAKTLFGAMADCLGLEQEQREDCLWEESGMVRVHRYPRCTAAGRVLGMDAHTDSSLISILNLDDVPGLQFLKDGQWVNLLHSPNTLVVNLGDMMQAISNDGYKSVMHRVGVNQEKERMSLCYFVFTKEDCVIQSSSYRPFTYKEFREKVQDDIKTTGFKVGLQRFKLAKDS